MFNLKWNTMNGPAIWRHLKIVSALLKLNLCKCIQSINNSSLFVIISIGFVQLKHHTKGNKIYFVIFMKLILAAHSICTKLLLCIALLVPHFGKYDLRTGLCYKTCAYETCRIPALNGWHRNFISLNCYKLPCSYVF